jgi:hypothetical protein
MQLKLKENPREWQKFTVVLAVMGGVLSWLAYHRRWLPAESCFGILAVLVAAIVLSLLFPRWFRPLYRGGMTVSFRIGQVMGAILLTLFFVVVLTPIALLLRLTGKDLLRLKRESGATTFWQPAKCSKEFDRMF